MPPQIETVPKIIFFRVGWMDRYRGIAGDPIKGGGRYVKEHAFGYEVFNFQPFGGKVYGYVQPHTRRGDWEKGKINLSRLGASKEVVSLDNVLVVWVATEPSNGAFVVGWYANATVFRNLQQAPPGSERKSSEAECGFYATAKTEDAVLLPPDERVFSIPQGVRSGFGQSNVWYADDPVIHRQIRADLMNFIVTRQLPPTQTNAATLPRQPDPHLRQRVEKIAVDLTIQYFQSLGYSVDSVERDNLGWDLEALLLNRKLKLEVKGLSGAQTVIELTPNEFSALRQHRDSYRICIVAQALTCPRLEVFGFSVESGQWETAEGKVLNIQELVGARCSAT